MGLRAASRMDVKAGTAADAWSAGLDFDFNTWLLSGEAWDKTLDLQVSYDGTNWQDSFEVDPERPIVFPFQAKSCRVKNNQAGENSTYQVAGLV